MQVAAAALVGQRLPAGGAAGSGLQSWGPGLAAGAPIRTAWHPLAVAPGWTVRVGDAAAGPERRTGWRAGERMTVGTFGILSEGREG